MPRIFELELDEPVTDLPILEQKAERKHLQVLVQKGFIKQEHAKEAWQLAGLRPQSGAWVDFLYKQALFIGGLLLGAGVAFFVASNWSVLSLWARLGIVGAILTFFTIMSFVLGKTILGKVSGILGAFLFGPLLAIIGHTYQTGADPWQLFFAWSVFVFIYSAINNSWQLFASGLVLTNITGIAYLIQELGQTPYKPGSTYLIVGLSGFNLLTAFFLPRIFWGSSRFLERGGVIGGLILLLPYGILTAALKINHEQVYGAVAFIVVLGALFCSSMKFRRDFFILSMSACAVVICLSTLFARLIFFIKDWPIAGTFVVGVVVVLQVWLVTRLLLVYRNSSSKELRS